MFFLAGADWIQMGFIMLVFLVGGIISISQFDYARARVQSFLDLLRDPIGVLRLIEKHRRFAVGEDRRLLGNSQPVVDAAEDVAGGVGGAEGLEVLRAVLRQHRDALAGPDAARGERVRQPPHAFRKFEMCERAAFEHDRRMLRKAAGVSLYIAAENHHSLLGFHPEALTTLPQRS